MKKFRSRLRSPLGILTALIGLAIILAIIFFCSLNKTTENQNQKQTTTQLAHDAGTLERYIDSPK